MTKLTVKKIPQLNTLVIQQANPNDYFTSTQKAIVISVSNLTALLNFLVQSEMISPEVLKGILEEYYMDKGEK